VRYRQPLSGARLYQKNGNWRLDFDSPQKFVAPGQSAVFYDQDGKMLGGGVIA
jgi:tRNA-specific 2-thiouridylase